MKLSKILSNIENDFAVPEGANLQNPIFGYILKKKTNKILMV